MSRDRILFPSHHHPHPHHHQQHEPDTPSLLPQSPTSLSSISSLHDASPPAPARPQNDEEQEEEEESPSISPLLFQLSPLQHPSSAEEAGDCSQQQQEPSEYFAFPVLRSGPHSYTYTYTRTQLPAPAQARAPVQTPTPAIYTQPIPPYASPPHHIRGLSYFSPSPPSPSPESPSPRPSPPEEEESDSSSIPPGLFPEPISSPEPTAYTPLLNTYHHLRRRGNGRCCGCSSSCNHTWRRVFVWGLGFAVVVIGALWGFICWF